MGSLPADESMSERAGYASNSSIDSSTCCFSHGARSIDDDGTARRPQTRSAHGPRTRATNPQQLDEDLLALKKVAEWGW